MNDLKHAFRLLWKNPGFTIAAVAALALGIGANAAIFSVVNAVLLKPLPYPHPDRIVNFLMTCPDCSGLGASVPEFAFWREQTSAFQDVTAYEGGAFNLTGGDKPEQIAGVRVTADYFRLFGAPIERGRTFTQQEDSPRGPRVVVISGSLWRRRFGADPRIIGGQIRLGEEPYTVIGVVGPKFEWDPARPPDIWLPYQFDLASADGAEYFWAAGRLRPGLTIGAAKAELKVASGRYRRKFELGPRSFFSVQPLEESVVGGARSSLLVLSIAVGLVLLIACANVANLLLVRATGRKREIAIRAAVGAGRARIIRQLLTESVLLSAAGGSIGLIAGMAALRGLLTLSPGNIPRIGQAGSAVTLDWRVLLFTAAVSIGTGLLFGLIPALGTSRADLNSTLKESASRAGGGFRQNKTRSLLVVSEMLLASVLLISAALLIRSYLALQTVDPGFNPHNVLTMEMSLTGQRFTKTAGMARVIGNGVERLESLPGVEAAALTCCMPLEDNSDLPMTIVGRPPTHDPYVAGWTPIAPHYFNVYRIPLRKGRTFTVRDDAASAPVVIINEALAKQFWPKSDPLEGQILIGHGLGPEWEEPPRRIIGVVADVRDTGLNRQARPNMYIPVSQMTNGIANLISRTGSMDWIVRTRGDPHPLSSGIQKELQQASGGLPVAHIRTMDEVVARSTARERFNTLLLGIFAAAALLLAAIGIYGLMAYSVQQRTQELGIRLALGAQPRQLRKMVLLQGMRLALIGVLLGTAAALGLTRFIASLLYGVKPWDPLVFAAVPIILSAVALVAIWVPARRAMRADPLNALRYE